MRFATHIKVELIREDIKIGLSWFEKMHNVKPKTIHNYYIKYRSIGYHGLIPLYKTDSNNFNVNNYGTCSNRREFRWNLEYW